VHFDTYTAQHPEKPRRSFCIFHAVTKSIGQSKFIECSREASEEELTTVHTKELVNFISKAWDDYHHSTGNNNEIVMTITPYFISRHEQSKPIALHLQSGFFCFDSSTPIGKNTAKVARISAAIAIDAASMLNEKLHDSSRPIIYALCRPPGHHATKNFYGGYCYFNNAALAAEVLSKSGPVVVFDVDYHHGNGTQDIFYERKDVYYISIHADPATDYPFYSGTAQERGTGEGLNYNRNFPLPRGTTWKEYKPIFEEALQIIRNYNPSSLIISLGLDTADGDPISKFHLVPNNYSEMGHLLKQLNIPLLVIQEGGYANEEILGSCASSFIKSLM